MLVYILKNDAYTEGIRAFTVVITTTLIHLRYDYVFPSY